MEKVALWRRNTNAAYEKFQTVVADDKYQLCSKVAYRISGGNENGNVVRI